MASVRPWEKKKWRGGEIRPGGAAPVILLAMGAVFLVTEFLARSGHGKNETLWLVAQAISEILPDGDKEKQLLQGLLNQRENLQKLTEDAKLF